MILARHLRCPYTYFYQLLIRHIALPSLPCSTVLIDLSSRKGRGTGMDDRDYWIYGAVVVAVVVAVLWIVVLTWMVW